MSETARDTDWMISVDDHLIEPPNVWVDRLPAKFRDRGPRWLTDDAGEAWFFEDVRQSLGGAVTNGAIWPMEDRPPIFLPLRWDEIPPACYDPSARIEAMNRDHLIASLMFPNLPGFAGSLFTRAKDKELALLCVQAYNDWVIDEFCASFPGRFIPLALVPLWDGRLAAAEAERVIAKGARTISYSMAPHNLGLPSIHDAGGFWDPLFSVVNDANVPLCTHLGTGFNGVSSAAGIFGTQETGAPDAPPGISSVLLHFTGQDTVLDWIYSGKFQQYPNLKVCLSENGIGWIPPLLQTADWTVQQARDRMTQITDPENNPLLTEDERRKAMVAMDKRSLRAKDSPLPSELFRDHMYGCFITDPIGLQLVHEIGIDNVMIETDFPHNSTWYPYSMDKANEALAGFSEEDRWKVLRGNAERVFAFTPAEPPLAAATL